MNTDRERDGYVGFVERGSEMEGRLGSGSAGAYLDTGEPRWEKGVRHQGFGRVILTK